MSFKGCYKGSFKAFLKGIYRVFGGFGVLGFRGSGVRLGFRGLGA